MSNLNRLSLLLALAVLPLGAQSVKEEKKAPADVKTGAKHPGHEGEAPTKRAKKVPAAPAPKKTQVTVSVFVKDADGSPVDGVLVTVDDREAMILTRGETDGSGNAQLVVIHGGDAWVRIRKNEHTPDQKKILIAPTESPIEVTFVMKKAMN